MKYLYILFIILSINTLYLEANYIEDLESMLIKKIENLLFIMMVLEYLKKMVLNLKHSK